jgi:hypothetical protein
MRVEPPKRSPGRSDWRQPAPSWKAPRSLSEQDVRALVSDMNSTGLAVVRDYLDPKDLAPLRDFIVASVNDAGGEYVVLHGRERVTGTLLEQLAQTEEFVGLIRRVYEAGTGRQAPDQSLYQVLRCLAGRSGRKHAFIFHFDSYVVTALLPITIPSKGQAGHLLIRPNLRKERSLYLINLVDKVILDNTLTQRLLKVGVSRNWLKFDRIEMVPGNLYIFWGYRSLHANEPCDVKSVRATALYHFGDPHADSPLRQRMGKVVV